MLRLALTADHRGHQLSRGHDHTTRNNIEERCLEQPDVGLYVTGLGCIGWNAVRLKLLSLLIVLGTRDLRF